MELIQGINLYLPQYLSSSEKDSMKEELRNFPTDGTKSTIYTCALKDADYLLQADGIGNLLYCNFPNTKVGNVSGILFSNTCDMSLENKRLNDCRIMYAPILRLDKYREGLLKKIERKRVEAHIKDIKSQYVSQIMYLPKDITGVGIGYDGIVFFDRVISIPLSNQITEDLIKNRIFTLSNFGFYLFLLKLPYHFTRVKEKIDRNNGIDLTV
jgi:hypothetical protein